MSDPQVPDDDSRENIPEEHTQDEDAAVAVAVEPPPVPKRRRPKVAARPQVANVVVRALAVTYLVISILALITFFSPWLIKNYSRGISVEQSGYQIAVGVLELNTKQTGRARERQRESFDKRIDAFPAAWIFPAGLLLVAVFAVIHFVLAGPYRPVFPFLGAAAAALVIITCLIVRFPFEKREELRDVRTASFILACVLTFAVLGLVIAHYATAALRQQLERERR